MEDIEENKGESCRWGGKGEKKIKKEIVSYKERKRRIWGRRAVETGGKNCRWWEKGEKEMKKEIESKKARLRRLWERKLSGNRRNWGRILRITKKDRVLAKTVRKEWINKKYLYHRSKTMNEGRKERQNIRELRCLK